MGELSDDEISGVVVVRAVVIEGVVVVGGGAWFVKHIF